jgi:hypothetical protein
VDRGSAQCVPGGTRLAQLENAIANDVSPDRLPGGEKLAASRSPRWFTSRPRHWSRSSSRWRGGGMEIGKIPAELLFAEFSPGQE